MRVIKVKDSTFENIENIQYISHGYSKNKKYATLMNIKEAIFINESKTKSTIKQIIKIDISELDNKKEFKLYLK